MFFFKWTLPQLLLWQSRTHITHHTLTPDERLGTEQVGTDLLHNFSFYSSLEICRASVSKSASKPRAAACLTAERGSCSSQETAAVKALALNLLLPSAAGTGHAGKGFREHGAPSAFWLQPGVKLLLAHGGLHNQIQWPSTLKAQTPQGMNLM